MELRLAAAWALGDEHPAALHLLEGHWGLPELEPIVRSVGFPRKWSGRMLARTDPVSIALSYLKAIWKNVRFPHMRLDSADTAPFAERATAVLKGRFSRRQALVVWLLASIGVKRRELLGAAPVARQASLVPPASSPVASCPATRRSTGSCSGSGVTYRVRWWS